MRRTTTSWIRRLAAIGGTALVLAAPTGGTAVAEGNVRVSDSAPSQVRTDGVINWGSKAGAHAGDPVEGSKVRTVASENGVSVHLRTNGLQIGHSYTLWVTYFNHPENCVHPPGDGFRCGIADMANPAAGGSSVYAGGLPSARGGTDLVYGWVDADEMPDQTWEIADFVAWRATSGQSPVAGLSREQVSMGMGLLVNPLGAEYQVVLWHHGAYDPDRYGDDQWKMHDGGCHIGENSGCADIQATGWMGTGAYSAAARAMATGS